MTAEDAEDMWCVYNLIQTGDKVTSSAMRKVAKTAKDASESGGGAISTERIRVRLTLEVTSVSFDPDTGNIRVSGRNASENDFVKIGAHHTTDLELHHAFDIEKDEWDHMQLSRLKEATNAAAKADIAAVVMETGLANVCLVTDRMTVVRAKIEMTVPKKRPGAAGHDKSMHRFFEAVLVAIQRHVDFTTIKAVVIASPGFIKDDFYTYMLEEAARRDLKAILENKHRFLLAHVASGHKRALQTVFMDASVMARLSDTRLAAEMNDLQVSLCVCVLQLLWLLLLLCDVVMNACCSCCESVVAVVGRGCACNL